MAAGLYSFLSPEWVARPCKPETFSLAEVSGDWHALGQAWCPHGPESGFRPGRARISWDPSALIFSAVFSGRGQTNRAVRLNERTWELGDVCEIFVRAEESPYYLEIHITPENRRLQLRFPLGAIQAIRAGHAKLDSYFEWDPSWIESWTEVNSDHFTVSARVPAVILGINQPMSPALSLSAAVCRYDYRGRTSDPILTSTAALQEPFFHRIEEWSPLRLSPD